jgi:alkylation response protein AidB-like acyl-CoA dehydrogenase
MDQPEYLQKLEPIVTGVVAKNAAEVDEKRMFPKAAIDALGRAGLLGLISAKEVGGLGQGPRAATMVVERIARECGSTAMVVCMHYSGTAVIEKHGSESVRKEIAGGKHLSTLAFSEAGSRSHFWAPVGTAVRKGSEVELTAHKSFVTSASNATAYVWASKPLAGKEASSIWLVPRTTPGIRSPHPFDGLGLRGNDSAAVFAESASIPEANLLGKDGEGFKIMMEIVLPIFNMMAAGVAVGLMESAVARTAPHVAGSKYEHLGATLADLPTIRSYLARMRCQTDMAKTLLFDTLGAIEAGRADAMLRVLQCKAVAGESATEVVDIAMRVCGGAAFRKEVAVERIFRDARAGTIMAPTTDVLYDFIGKAVAGMPLF